jgi:hypothetical protein
MIAPKQESERIFNVKVIESTKPFQVVPSILIL